MSSPQVVLAETEPALMSRISGDSIARDKTMHETGQLHSAGLLTLILDPNLEDKITPGAILAAHNLALFQLLPLILAAVQRIGELSTKRQAFVKLVSTLRTRIVACRGLKLRFLLLVQNPAFAAHWDVRMVHRRHCYITARQYLAEISKDEDSRLESSESVRLANDLAASNSSDSKLGTGVPLDTPSLVSFAARTLLNQEHGIRTRTIIFRMRPIQSAFFAAELIDGIMERSNFRSRDEAVLIAQRLLDLGVIHKVATTSRQFRDNHKSVYQCHFALHRDDDGHCRVLTSDGYELTSWDAVEDANAKQIKQISVQVPMDMIDLQSFEFWTKTVFVRGVDKGFRYGYRAITHPIYCEGLDARANLDFTPLQDKVAHENPEYNSSIQEKEVEVKLSLSKSVVLTEEINDMHQEAAVVGSVVVRKVFSSIARPMIVQLRVPLENADLDDDDHHIVLPPGLLVKEGDNLMQDLGVETMFQCFNHIWSHTPDLVNNYGVTPVSVSYEVFPVSTTQGFMEAVTGLVSLKDYDWKFWRDNYGKDKKRVNEMLRSTAGAYVGAYVVGYVLFFVFCFFLFLSFFPFFSFFFPFFSFFFLFFFFSNSCSAGAFVHI